MNLRSAAAYEREVWPAYNGKAALHSFLASQLANIDPVRLYISTLPKATISSVLFTDYIAIIT